MLRYGLWLGGVTHYGGAGGVGWWWRADDGEDGDGWVEMVDDDGDGC